MSERPTDRHEWKETAHHHFQRWAHHYDRTIINYLLFRPCYRRVLIQLRHWQRRGFDHLRILDIGCGTGSLLIQSFLHGPKIRSAVGLDMSPNMIEYAQQKVPVLHLDDRLRFMIGDAEHLPFEDNSFDVITCCNSFHHYPHQIQALREMFRVLDRDGRLILIDGHRDDPIGFVIFDVCVARVENHVHHCSGQRFRDLITDAGFSRIHQHVFGITPPAIMNVAYTDK